jgi:pimeloyl-ACP methyl ester carboxylesterase
MLRFESDGLSLRYIDEGAGEPMLLIHGFASNVEMNWINPGWVSFLTGLGRRVIAFDHRGHGQSEKLYDSASYGAPLMAEDACRLLDHLSVNRADVMGYSMGARVTAFLSFNHPERVRAAIFGGMGESMLNGLVSSDAIAAGLEAPNRDAITDVEARTFRVFAETTRSDLRALAACMRSQRSQVTPEMLGKLDLPVLIAVGSADNVAGSGHVLAAHIKEAEVLEIPGRDHNRAVGDRVFKEGVADFLARRL